MGCAGVGPDAAGTETDGAGAGIDSARAGCGSGSGSGSWPDLAAETGALDAGTRGSAAGSGNLDAGTGGSAAGSWGFGAVLETVGAVSAVLVTVITGCAVLGTVS